ncbi:helix-turn-helix domain-containing protein [Halococcus qingdaonensis]|uniref:helix-turn-helix domain-containing protein n=1 Tax=Halococcus qingdaonensis TaxID=224402 RepID=UPI0021165A86|nr:helix-turn-helix domain-containing protein [Halococcus qingdaonensis]
MATRQLQMVNEDHQPSKSEERVLEFLLEGRDEGCPWGRANPKLIREHTGMSKSTVEYALRTLRTAGWVRNPAEGIYEYNEDPRENKDG